MSRRGYILGFFWLAAFASAAGQRSEDWLPVTSRDLEIKAVPGDPGGSAIQLYYADSRDDMHQSEFVYRRVKILKDTGERYANVEIEIPAHATIADLQARTIHPDKSIVEFSGRPFERIVARYQGEKLIAKAFTMPAVTVGSIIEYKYRLVWNQYFNDPSWTLQHSLYTVQEDFSLRRYTGPMRTRHLSDQTQLSYVTSNLPEGVILKDTGPGVELQVSDVPAFKPEPYMPPEANFKPRVQFFYGGREIESPEIFWREIGKGWFEKTEHFIGNHESLKDAAAKIMGTETDPEQRLRKLYGRAQQTRNLTFQLDGVAGENAPTSFKPNENVMEVFTRKYGSQNEIAELFAALARAGGFGAQILRASDRRMRVFDPKLLSENQLGSELVRVNGEGLDLFLDPGTEFCPFGLVSWTSTSAPALQLDKNGGSFVVVPTATADRSVVRRTANVALGADGTLQGEVTLEFKGNEALDRRLAALSTDDAGRKRDLESELESWLPPGFVVQLRDVDGWQSSEEPLAAHFTIRSDDFASSAENRLLVPASLFRSPEADAFTRPERRFPVYFPYTHEVVDKVDVRVPAGYRLETMPDGQDIKSSATRFITTRSLRDQQLLLTRALVVNSIYFDPQQYGELKSFFTKLRAVDDEQIVLAAEPHRSSRN